MGYGTRKYWQLLRPLQWTWLELFEASTVQLGDHALGRAQPCMCEKSEGSPQVPAETNQTMPCRVRCKLTLFTQRTRTSVLVHLAMLADVCASAKSSHDLVKCICVFALSQATRQATYCTAARSCMKLSSLLPGPTVGPDHSIQFLCSLADGLCPTGALVHMRSKT